MNGGSHYFSFVSKGVRRGEMGIYLGENGYVWQSMEG